MQAKISPNLWFDTEALEAAEYYASVFPNSRVTRITHYNEAGPRDAGTVMTVTLSADHRVIDGAVAAAWMAAFVRRIAAWARC